VSNNNIIKSFFSKDNLNSQVWQDEDTLNPDVRAKLLEIATEFIDFLSVPILVEDIIFTGSLANFNWSEFSDIDLHIVANFAQFDEDLLELYQELFKVKKTIFNSDFNIKIFGYDVELYVQNSTEVHFSTGVYSVLFDEWIEKPVKEDKKIDTEVLKGKINQWMSKIDTVIKNATDEDIESAKEYIKNLKDKLKKFRSGGLKEGGEYSYENLTFKYLRRNGYLDKLFNFEKHLVDRELSLD
jgi:predicted nucleotidyltransferase